MPGARVERALGELVAHLAQTDDEAREFPRVLSPEEDLPAELLARHRLTSLAYKAGYAGFRDEYVKNALLADLRERVLAEAVAALRAAGVRVVLLKGISYVGVIYQDPAERPMGDIDLLVPPHAHDTAVSALASLGYRAGDKRVERSPVHHARTLTREDGATIDLHRSIMQPLRSRIDLADVWERALPAIERDDGCERLDPVDEACFHLAHIARHELMVPVIAYVEGRRLIARRDVSWPRVLARAREFRLGRAIAAAGAMTTALARGETSVQWPDRRCRVLPDPAEVLLAEPVPRGRQILRKTALVEGPTELAGLFAVAAYERLRR